jgi:transcription initiation factor TFIIIB Brf1 subunit/transcription initiation factor TFIIB
MKMKNNLSHNPKAPICPKCGSKDTRAKISTGELWCRRCGYIDQKEEFFKDKK